MPPKSLSKKEKVAIVREWLRSGQGPEAVGARHGLRPAELLKWKEQFGVRLEEPAWAAFGWPLAAGAAGLLMVFAPLLLARGSWIPGTLGDARLHIYLMEHILRWLSGAPGHASLWDPPFFYPAKNVGGYSDIELGCAPFFWLWRWAGLAPDSAFKAWLVSMAALNFLAAYALFNKALKLPSAASSAGAFLFAFGSARTAQLEHGQLIPHFYTIAAVYALVKIVDAAEPAPRWVLVFFASLVAQLYSAFYFGWYFIFAAGILGLWALALPATRVQLVSALWRNAYAILGAGLAALACLAPMLSHYLDVAKQVGLRDYANVTGMLPRPQSWLYMGWGSWLYHGMNKLSLFRALPSITEQALGLGLATSVCCFLGFYRRRQRAWTPALVLASLSLVLCFTWLPGGWSFWRVIYGLVPGAAALRALSRIGVFMLLPASLGLAYFFSDGGRPGLLLALALLCGAEQRWANYFVFDQNAARRDAAELAARIPAGCESFIYIPRQTAAQAPPWWKYQLDAMAASMERGIPTLNGYSGNFPPGYEPLNDIVIRSPEDEARIDQGLAQWLAQGGLNPKGVCVLKLPAS